MILPCQLKRVVELVKSRSEQENDPASGRQICKVLRLLSDAVFEECQSEPLRLAEDLDGIARDAHVLIQEAELLKAAVTRLQHDFGLATSSSSAPDSQECGPDRQCEPGLADCSTALPSGLQSVSQPQPAAGQLEPSWRQTSFELLDPALHELLLQLSERSQDTGTWGDTEEFSKIVELFVRLSRPENTRGASQPSQYDDEIVQELKEVLQEFQSCTSPHNFLQRCAEEFGC